MQIPGRPSLLCNLFSSHESHWHVFTCSACVGDSLTCPAPRKVFASECTVAGVLILDSGGPAALDCHPWGALPSEARIS